MAEVLLRVFLRWSCRAALVASLLGSTHGWAQPTVDPSIPLAERLFPALVPLLEKAVEQSPRAINSNLEFLIAQENIGQQRARLLPSVGGYMTYSYTQDRRLDREDPLYGAKLMYNMSLTQPLYHWGALKAGHQYAKLTAKIAENNHAETCRLLVLEVRAAYLRLVVSKANVKRADEALRLVRAEVQHVETQLKAGLMSRADLDGPVLRSQYAELDRDRAHEDYRLAKMTVERLTGSEALSDESIPDHVPKIVFPRERLAALSDHFDAAAPGSGIYRLEVARLRVEQEKLNYAILDKNLRPKFNFVTGVSQDEVGYTGSPADKARTQSFFGGININWAVFDGFSTSAQRRASRLRIRQLKAEQTDREREQDELVKNQVRQLEFSARGAALSEHTLDQANEMVRSKENDVRLGLAAEGEIEGVKLSRDATQIQTMAVRNDLLGRIAEFISSVGRDPALQAFPPSPP
ncbi:MAG TPA: TolC family protein [Opitutaceae bacterium]|nr:TolC family protein [Opitutaceae bacterium]